VCLVYRAKVGEVVVFTEAPLVSLLLVEFGLVRAHYENLYKFTSVGFLLMLHIF